MTITSNELSLFTLKNVMVHELPLQNMNKKSKPILSAAPSQLTPDVRTFFEDKVRGAAREFAFEVEVNPDTSSPVPAQLHCLVTQTDPVKPSQKIAQHLFKAQTGSMSSGLLVVGQASVGPLPAVAVIKLEKQDGVRLMKQSTAGQVTFSLRRIRDLMLTQKTRVYKMGVFILRGKTIDTLDGMVVDSQRPGSKTIASFFLDKFLGFSLAALPDVTTQAFLKGVERFVNTADVSSHVKAHCFTAALVEIQSNTKMISPRDFAKHHVPSELHNQFHEVLQQEGVPKNRFRKDDRLVSGRLKRVLVNFENGVKISVPPGHIGDTRVSELADGITEVTIRGKLKKVN